MIASRDGVVSKRTRVPLRLPAPAARNAAPPLNSASASRERDFSSVLLTLPPAPMPSRFAALELRPRSRRSISPFVRLWRKNASARRRRRPSAASSSLPPLLPLAHRHWRANFNYTLPIGLCMRRGAGEGGREARGAWNEESGSMLGQHIKIMASIGADAPYIPIRGKGLRLISIASRYPLSGWRARICTRRARARGRRATFDRYFCVTTSTASTCPAFPFAREGTGSLPPPRAALTFSPPLQSNLPLDSAISWRFRAAPSARERFGFESSAWNHSTSPPVPSRSIKMKGKRMNGKAIRRDELLALVSYGGEWYRFGKLIPSITALRNSARRKDEDSESRKRFMPDSSVSLDKRCRACTGEG